MPLQIIILIINKLLHTVLNHFTIIYNKQWQNTFTPVTFVIRIPLWFHITNVTFSFQTVMTSWASLFKVKIFKSDTIIYCSINHPINMFITVTITIFVIDVFVWYVQKTPFTLLLQVSVTCLTNKSIHSTRIGRAVRHDVQDCETSLLNTLTNLQLFLYYTLITFLKRFNFFNFSCFENSFDETKRPVSGGKFSRCAKRAGKFPSGNWALFYNRRSLRTRRLRLL